MRPLNCFSTAVLLTFSLVWACTPEKIEIDDPLPEEPIIVEPPIEKSYVNVSFVPQEIAPDNYDNPEFLKINWVNWFIFDNKGNSVYNRSSSIMGLVDLEIDLIEGEDYTLFAFVNFGDLDLTDSEDLENISFSFSDYEQLRKNGLPYASKMTFTASADEIIAVNFEPLFARVVFADFNPDKVGVKNTTNVLFPFKVNSKHEFEFNFKPKKSDRTENGTILYVPENICGEESENATIVEYIKMPRVNEFRIENIERGETYRILK